jgi:hypothetical protein
VEINRKYKEQLLEQSKSDITDNGIRQVMQNLLVGDSFAAARSADRQLGQGCEFAFMSQNMRKRALKYI